MMMVVLRWLGLCCGSVRELRAGGKRSGHLCERGRVAGARECAGTASRQNDIATCGWIERCCGDLGQN